MAVYLIENVKDKLESAVKAIDSDIATLRSCRDLEDITNTDWQSLNLKWYLKEIQEHRNPLRYVYEVNNSFDYDKDDDFTNFEIMSLLLQELKACKKVYLSKIERDKGYSEKVEELLPEIESLSSKYELLDKKVIKTDWHDELLYIFEPTEDSHKACIQFVDDVADAINGRYSGTGRGGSWTIWNLLSDTGVEVKAGWSADEKWEVSVTLNIEHY